MNDRAPLLDLRLPAAAAVPEALRDPAAHWAAVDAAAAELDPPFAVLDRGALAWNAHDILRRAQGMPVRVASKSVRIRAVLEAVLALPGYRGVLAFTLPEALWLAESGFDDIVVAYPSADRAALRRLASDPALAAAVTIMVDDPAHLDLVDELAPPAGRARVRVALDLDASLLMEQPDGSTRRAGVHRSPLHSADDLAALAQEVARRPGFRLVGLMSYEAQVAGVTDEGPGAEAIREMKRASVAELAVRRPEAVARVREIAQAAGHDLEFVNGGGTGSIETTREDPSVTEVAAGSGLLGPHLFDHYTAFTPAPAAAFALSVVRKPAPDIATLLGGGWIASGSPGPDRLPQPVWPAGLEYTPTEGAGEVQTPLRGEAAQALRVGDRVWLRHTKSGELAEHVPAVRLIDSADGGRLLGALPTYRGEGRCFL
ncbi:alanine racemase [Brevibacterium album]|uniref:alanine racemase n=1 Tax=Brevibacterium album TaxID=417948 RepID=UPI0004004E3A|nr:alanine racemase [Brevibacterium album]